MSFGFTRLVGQDATNLKVPGRYQTLTLPNPTFISISIVVYIYRSTRRLAWHRSAGTAVLLTSATAAYAFMYIVVRQTSSEQCFACYALDKSKRYTLATILNEIRFVILPVLLSTVCIRARAAPGWPSMAVGNSHLLASRVAIRRSIGCAGHSRFVPSGHALEVRCVHRSFTHQVLRFCANQDACRGFEQ